MHGPTDALGWARQPRSVDALRTVIELAKSNRKLAAILEQLVREGVATPAGELLRRWNGMHWEVIDADRT